MRKNVLSLSIAALIGGLGLAGGASAAVLAPPVGAEGVHGEGSAVALVEATNGIGHILLVPYFTTQDGQHTLFSIVNTDTINGKAVKVRFRGASNTDDIMDFQVFLSPGDVWTADVSAAANGISQISTPDNSCTIPFIGSEPKAFTTDRVQNPALTAADKNAQTREGYIEILNMADVPKLRSLDQGAATTTAPNNPLYTAIKHTGSIQGGGVAPCTAAVLEALNDDPLNYSVANVPAVGVGIGAAAGWTNFGTSFGKDGANTITTKSATGKGLDYPTGGLLANWIILNQPKNTAFSGDATAIVASSDTDKPVPGIGNLVYFPQIPTEFKTTAITTGTEFTGITFGNINTVTADPLLRFSPTTAQADTLVVASDGVTSVTRPAFKAGVFDLPDLSTPYITSVPAAGALSSSAQGFIDASANLSGAPLTQAFSLTYSIARLAVINEYLAMPEINGKTDMLISMPTRRYHTAMNYAWVAKPLEPGVTNGQVFSVYGNFNSSTMRLGVLTPNGFSAPSLTTGSYYMPYFTAGEDGNTSVNGFNQICTNGITSEPWDQSENTATSLNGAEFSPRPIKPGAALCGEVNTMAINLGNSAKSGVLGATVSTSDATLNLNNPKAGWIRLNTTTSTGNGLPVLGSAFQTMFNNVNGVATTYGMRYTHRYVNAK